jgi:hypothetical protein
MLVSIGVPARVVATMLVIAFFVSGHGFSRAEKGHL